jgi:hypothetical protein
VLEAYLNWTSDDYTWQWQLGRIKTQWSTGFNWTRISVASATH